MVLLYHLNGSRYQSQRLIFDPGGEKYDILWKVERYYPILILQNPVIGTFLRILRETRDGFTTLASVKFLP